MASVRELSETTGLLLAKKWQTELRNAGFQKDYGVEVFQALAIDQHAAFTVVSIIEGGEFSLSCVESDRPPKHASKAVLGRMDQLRAHARRNWFFGRQPIPDDSRAWSAVGGRWSHAGDKFLLFQCSAERVDPAHIISNYRPDEMVGTSNHPPESLPSSERLHLGTQEIGKRREGLAIRRMVRSFAPNLLGQLGLLGGWWCAVEVPRADLLEGEEGDIDLLAGPVELNVSEIEYAARLRAEAQRMSLFAHPSRLHEMLRLRLCQERRFKWPPDLRKVVALEVKASYFDGRRWKAAQKGPGKVRPLIGQLKKLHRLGFHRVACLHLGATTPQSVPGEWPWFSALRAIRAAEEAFEPVLSQERLTESGIGEVGYYHVLLGAVAHQLEGWSGAGGSTVVSLVKATTIESSEQPWKQSLRRKLATVGQPYGMQSFLVVDDGEWTYSSMVN